MYITENRFRRMGLGTRLTGLSSVQIQEQLRTAAVAVDSYCNVPVYPQRYSFRGGTITGEQHSWPDHYANRRVYPFHTPLKAVESIRVDATNNLFVDFEPEDYYINRNDGYVEIINFALTRVGIWGYAGVPSMGLVQPVAVLDYSYGYQFPVVDEPLIALENSSGEEDWTEYMATSGFWEPTIDPTIKKNGVEMDPGDYSANLNDGIVTMDPALTASDEVTASYTYTVPWEVARASALATSGFIGEAALIAQGMSGIESLEVEEVRLRRIGSRSGAEKGAQLPAAAQLLLDGYRFMTVR